MSSKDRGLDGPDTLKQDHEGMPVTIAPSEDGLWIHYHDYFQDGTSGAHWTTQQLEELIQYAIKHGVLRVQA